MVGTASTGIFIYPVLNSLPTAIEETNDVGVIVRVTSECSKLRLQRVVLLFIEHGISGVFLHAMASIIEENEGLLVTIVRDFIP